ncbi:hypothetical protein OW763_14165 [Clostridium aestuarii]|uniref:Phage-Barnase-EndoU-ColicinE5/D-RelE like nuclease 3 domain-containing protein n=1 Tax=Clostridium aestuarii TaxID=338193 RepID=A0ABT4D2J5_9CLOT|nr:hypothetical protein [Clostridium aestuarii]MCY6485475.1 hypothetical protein [Clostridium aestuarii]
MGSNKKRLDTYYSVGQINKNIANIVNFNYTGTVYAAPGVIKHIKKRHKHQLNTDVLNNLIAVIETIISSPDYIGHHPEKEGTGIEFIKKLADNLLVGVEVDLYDNYIYVATMHPIPQAKINNRVHSGRLQEYVKTVKVDEVAATK